MREVDEEPQQDPGTVLPLAVSRIEQFQAAEVGDRPVRAPLADAGEAAHERSARSVIEVAEPLYRDRADVAFDA